MTAVSNSGPFHLAAGMLLGGLTGFAIWIATITPVPIATVAAKLRRLYSYCAAPPDPSLGDERTVPDARGSSSAPSGGLMGTSRNVYSGDAEDRGRWAVTPSMGMR